MTDEEHLVLRRERIAALAHNTRLREQEARAYDAARQADELCRTLRIAVSYVEKRISQIDEQLAEDQDFT